MNNKIKINIATLVALLLFACAVVAPGATVYPDGRPAAVLRMDAKDQGVILKHGDGPGQCDIRGAREALIFEENGVYHLFYDGAGAKGWLACLATSKDLMTWEKKGPILDFGRKGENDSAAATSPWVYHDGKEWHMFYLGTPNASPSPNFIPYFPYLTMKAKSASLAGPWIKQPEVVPFSCKPNTYYDVTASPGHIVKQGDDYLMFLSVTANAQRPKRTLSIARTKDLNGPWVIDPQPIVSPEEQIENSSLYFEPSNRTWFLFTNHIGLGGGEYTDAVWVYWSKDLNKWDPANKAVVLDGQNCTWSKACIGMPSVVKVGNRLAVFYDTPGGNSTSHMGRDIGLAWLDLPLVPPALISASDVCRPVNLRCEYRENPLGVDVANPRLSWVMGGGGRGAEVRGQRQTAYQILVASTPELLSKDGGDLWDSGKVTSDQSVHIAYQGKPLSTGMPCCWKVRIWDQDGRTSKWSQPATWGMGILTPAGWTARWISTEVQAQSVIPAPPTPPPGQTDEPYVRRAFDLEAVPASALATVNVMGFYELYVNGKKVGPNVMGPALSNYLKRSLYETYDLAPYLKKGRNCIGLWLSRGCYLKRLNPGVQHDTAIARLQLDMIVDGRPIRIATDGQWRCKSSGRSVIGNWAWNGMGGEQVDARLDDPRWADPDTDVSDWFPVTEVAAPAIPADAQKCPPMRVLKTIPALSCTKLAGGKYRLDFGTQLTGWLKLRLRGQAAGHTIAIQYADKLEPLQTFNQTDRFICAGKTEEEYESKFNYHGFRWTIVEGLVKEPQLADATAELIGADFETRGDFECSSDQLNRMHKVNLWTILSLAQTGFLSDCPHRERMGYGDGQVSIESCMMNYSMQPFYDKWAIDWCDGADPQTGYMPHTAPQYKSGGGGPAWGGSAQALTWRNYLYYDDTRIVERNLEACRRHIEAIEARAKDGVVRAFGGTWDFIGDWVPPGRGMDTNNWPPRPAAELFNNCYRLYLREQWARMADVLGRHDEAKACRAELDRLRPLVHAAFYDKDKQRYVLDEQCYYLMPLMTGVVPEDLRPAMLKKLEDCICITRKGHLDTGMLGTYFLINYLMEIGRDDLLWLIVTQKDYPGWGYMLEKGATTWWEQWNGHWSQIHSCFTSLDGWFYQGLAGIHPDPMAPGFKKIIIKPAIVGDLTWVKCHYDSPYGRIVSNWKLEGAQLTMEVTIPGNATATVYVPANDAAVVTESGGRIDEAKAPALTCPEPCRRSNVEGVKFLRMENNAAVYAVGSGIYQFQSQL